MTSRQESWPLSPTSAIRQPAAGPAGLAAGKFAERLGAAPNAPTFHLQKLAVAGLVASRREGRFVYYRAEFDALLASAPLVGACSSESSERCGPRCPSVVTHVPAADGPCQI